MNADIEKHISNVRSTPLDYRVNVNGKPVDTAERIEQAAMALLDSAPWESISTRQICARADVSLPTLYHHFGDKRGLGLAVANKGFLHYFTGRRTLAHSGDPVERLRFAWDAHVEFGLSHRGLYSLMFGEGRADDDLPGAVIARDVFRRLLGDVARNGGLLVPADRAALVLEGSLVGATFQALRSGFDAAVSAHLRDAVLASLITDTPLTATRPEVRTAAAQLSETLRAEPSASMLGEPETALFLKWLDTLAR